jgi:hypothetical protein
MSTASFLYFLKGVNQMAKLGVKSSLVCSLAALSLAGTAGLAQAESRSDWLSEGESITYEGYLLEGEDVFGACDEDCTDLDIYLYDAVSGDLIAEDVLVDSFPVVTAPYDGDFLIEVYMVTCSVEPCLAEIDSDHGF